MLLKSADLCQVRSARATSDTTQRHGYAARGTKTLTLKVFQRLCRVVGHKHDLFVQLCKQRQHFVRSGCRKGNGKGEGKNKGKYSSLLVGRKRKSSSTATSA